MADTAGESSSTLSANGQQLSFDGPQIWSRSYITVVDKDTPREPYLTFKIGPRPLRRLVVKIWSHDQGWCNPEYRVEDPYANSQTWFALGVIPDDAPDDIACKSLPDADLYEIQRNVRASAELRCHFLVWNLNVPVVEEEIGNNEVQGWLESVSSCPGMRIGVFPLAQYPGWANVVHRVVVQLYDDAALDAHEPHDPTSVSTLGDDKGKGKAVDAGYQGAFHDPFNTLPAANTYKGKGKEREMIE